MSHDIVDRWPALRGAEGLVIAGGIEGELADEGAVLADDADVLVGDERAYRFADVEPFGWIKTIAGRRQLRYRGRESSRAWFKITAAVNNLLRITTLDIQPA